MHKTKHAQQISQRFREIIETAGDSLADEHYNELSLLIEAGIDTALVEYMEKVADELDKLARNVRHDAEVFD